MHAHLNLFQSLQCLCVPMERFQRVAATQVGECTCMDARLPVSIGIAHVCIVPEQPVRLGQLFMVPMRVLRHEEDSRQQWLPSISEVLEGLSQRLGQTAFIVLPPGTALGHCHLLGRCARVLVDRTSLTP